jgi:hypothetical protein
MVLGKLRVLALWIQRSPQKTEMVGSLQFHGLLDEYMSTRVLNLLNDRGWLGRKMTRRDSPYSLGFKKNLLLTTGKISSRLERIKKALSKVCQHDHVWWVKRRNNYNQCDSTDVSWALCLIITLLTQWEIRLGYRRSHTTGTSGERRNEEVQKIQYLRR